MEEYDTAPQSPVSMRNFLAVVNLLRVLQKVVKGKHFRLTALVLHKAPAIFKRMLKVEHPMLHLYVLKILKDQVRYLGKGWRKANMRIMSK